NRPAAIRSSSETALSALFFADSSVAALHSLPEKGDSAGPIHSPCECSKMVSHQSELERSDMTTRPASVRSVFLVAGAGALMAIWAACSESDSANVGTTSTTGTTTSPTTGSTSTTSGAAGQGGTTGEASSTGGANSGGAGASGSDVGGHRDHA